MTEKSEDILNSETDCLLSIFCKDWNKRISSKGRRYCPVCRVIHGCYDNTEGFEKKVTKRKESDNGKSFENLKQTLLRDDESICDCKTKQDFSKVDHFDLLIEGKRTFNDAARKEDKGSARRRSDYVQKGEYDEAKTPEKQLLHRKTFHSKQKPNLDKSFGNVRQTSLRNEIDSSYCFSKTKLSFLKADTDLDFSKKDSGTPSSHSRGTSDRRQRYQQRDKFGKCLLCDTDKKSSWRPWSKEKCDLGKLSLKVKIPF